MPRTRVNPKWLEDRKIEVRAFLTPARTPIPPVTTSYNPSAQWYIQYLDSKNLKCKVINMGAGVKKIIHIDNLCPQCQGRGVLK